MLWLMSIRHNLCNLNYALRYQYDHRPLSMVIFGALLIFLFEPPEFIYFMQKYGVNAPAMNALENLFILGEILCSFFALVVYFFESGMRSKHDWPLVAFLILTVISSFVNEPFNGLIRWIAKCITFFGLTMLLRWMSQVSTDWLKKSLLLLFVSIFIASIITILVVDFDFVSGLAKNKIYYFGGKNSIFSQVGIPLVAAITIWTAGQNSNDIGYTPTIMAVLVALFAVKVDSASSFVFMVALGFLLLLIRIGKYPNRIINIASLSIIGFLFFVDTVLLKTNYSVGWLLHAVNRSASFSGRDVIWDHALSLIQSKPLFGVGDTFSFVQRDRSIAGHPHCFYLQIACQFGLPALILFCSDCAQIIQSRFLSQGEALVDALGVIFLVVLLHSMFDFIDWNIYFLIRFLVTMSSKDVLSE